MKIRFQLWWTFEPSLTTSLIFGCLSLLSSFSFAIHLPALIDDPWKVWKTVVAWKISQYSPILAQKDHMWSRLRPTMQTERKWKYPISLFAISLEFLWTEEESQPCMQRLAQTWFFFSVRRLGWLTRDTVSSPPCFDKWWWRSLRDELSSPEIGIVSLTFHVSLPQMRSGQITESVVKMELEGAP